jgi:hypothetical protein
MLFLEASDRSDQHDGLTYTLIGESVDQPKCIARHAQLAWDARTCIVSSHPHYVREDQSSQMSSRHDNALSIILLKTNNQANILRLTTSSPAFLTFLVRQAFLVQVDSLRSFGFESVRSVHDHQSV